MKRYFIFAVIILMMITSLGAYGYLSNQFQKAIKPNTEVSLKIETLSNSIKIAEEEKKQIILAKSNFDSQVSKLPDNQVRTRQRLQNTFKPEYDRLNKRLDIIDSKLESDKTELKNLELHNIEQSSEIGPILFIAKSVGMTPESISKYVILIIILIFDPLAIMLILAGNFLLKKKKEQDLKLKQEEAYQNGNVLELDELIESIDKAGPEVLEEQILIKPTPPPSYIINEWTGKKIPVLEFDPEPEPPVKIKQPKTHLPKTPNKVIEKEVEPVVKEIQPSVLEAIKVNNPSALFDENSPNKEPSKRLLNIYDSYKS